MDTRMGDSRDEVVVVVGDGGEEWEWVGSRERLMLVENDYDKILRGREDVA